MSLGEKITKKAEELQKERKEVYSQMNRKNIAYGRIIKTIITIVALVLIYVYWNYLVSHLATFLTKGTNLVQDPTQAPTVANYLLLFLIIATISVESIPFLGISGIGQASGSIVSPTE